MTDIEQMKIGYADPPYINCAHLYKGHPDYAGEVDHVGLITLLQDKYDGWVLHASATPQSIGEISRIARDIKGVRWCAWVKGFAAFKRNVPVAYAWEPVLIKPVRKQEVSSRIKPLRDWIECSITMQRGLTGAKPERVCHWAFEIVGAKPEDRLDDMFPGTGAVTRAWETWCRRYQKPEAFQMDLTE